MLENVVRISILADYEDEKKFKSQLPVKGFIN